MVHSINGADFGDLLFRAEVLQRINKVILEAKRMGQELWP